MLFQIDNFENEHMNLKLSQSRVKQLKGTYPLRDTQKVLEIQDKGIQSYHTWIIIKIFLIEFIWSKYLTHINFY